MAGRTSAPAPALAWNSAKVRSDLEPGRYGRYSSVRWNVRNPASTARSSVSARSPLSRSAETIFEVSTAPKLKRPSSSGVSRPMSRSHRTRSSGQPASSAISAAEYVLSTRGIVASALACNDGGTPIRGGDRDEEIAGHDVRESRRGDAGARWAGGGRGGRVRVRRLDRALLGRRPEQRHGRHDGPPVRSPAGASDLRTVRRVLADRAGGGRRQAAERGHQVRGLAEPSLARLGSVGPDRGSRGRGTEAEGDGWSGAPGPREREPRPDADAARPRRRVPADRLPDHDRLRETAVRRR